MRAVHVSFVKYRDTVLLVTNLVMRAVHVSFVKYRDTVLLVTNLVMRAVHVSFVKYRDTVYININLLEQIYLMKSIGVHFSSKSIEKLTLKLFFDYLRK